jgi:DNA-binding HxlR family transcriptional regulator
MKINKEKAHCPVDYAFKRVGGKYKGRILWVLRQDVLRYGELKRAIVGITPKMLTQTLKELESDELVSRKVYLEVPPKVEYSLTETGKELIPLIRQLRSWGEHQMARDKS